VTVDLLSGRLTHATTVTVAGPCRPLQRPGPGGHSPQVC